MYARDENFGLRFDFAINDFFAISLPKRHSQTFQKRARLLIVARRRDNRDVHPPLLIDFVEINLRKDQLLFDSDRVVAAAVKGPGRNPAKISDARQSHRDQPIEKLVHPL